jgi:hypothetical protein
MGKIYFTNMS